MFILVDIGCPVTSSTIFQYCLRDDGVCMVYQFHMNLAPFPYNDFIMGERRYPNFKSGLLCFHDHGVMSACPNVQIKNGSAVLSLTHRADTTKPPLAYYIAYTPYTILASLARLQGVKDRTKVYNPYLPYKGYLVYFQTSGYPQLTSGKSAKPA